ncbi:MAG TPA: TolC family protein [Candidatus Hydrogenedens sp.]|nr:TolC family protein [Candidatus Hydrogenedens sp.]
MNFKEKIYIHKFLLTTIFIAMGILTSCAHVNPEKYREESLNEFKQKIEEQTPEKVKAEQELTLDECIQIALQNNAQVKISEIEQKIAKLEKNIAFSNFLPQISSEFQIVNYDRKPMVNFGPLSTAMQDQTIRMDTIQLQLPIFAPATWFLYDLRNKGVNITNLVKDYTCQMIALQTTALYFQILALENIEKTLQLQLDNANKLTEQVNAFYEEGMLTQSQKEQVYLLKQSRERDLKQCQQEIETVKAQFNTVLGISPLQKIKLSKQVDIPIPANNTEEMIYIALKNHPRILIEDRKVEISEDEIKLAITNFLPLIGGFTQWQYTSNSYTLYSQSVLSGLHGILTLFNGFANIQQYRIAREKREKAFLEREETSLSLMAGVIRAKANWEKAKEDLKLAEQAYTYYKEKYRETNEKWNEGMVAEVDIVTVQNELSIAEINLINARIQEQIAIAVLWNSTGKTYSGSLIYNENEKEKSKDGKK